MAHAYYGTQLSPNRVKTPEGFLVVRDVPLSRTGSYTYLGSELSDNLPPMQTFKVYRDDADVFEKDALNSFEGKAVTSPHPPEFVNCNNYGAYAKGHIQNVRRGGKLPDGQFAMIGDVIITDAMLVNLVENGSISEVSAGYDCKYTQLPDGRFAQKDIRGNHLAIVPQGRAGADIRLLDAAPIEEAVREQEEAVDVAKNTVEEASNWRKFFMDLGVIPAPDAKPIPQTFTTLTTHAKDGEPTEAERRRMEKDTEEEKERKEKERQDASDKKTKDQIDASVKAAVDGLKPDLVKTIKDAVKSVRDEEEVERREAQECTCDMGDDGLHAEGCPMRDDNEDMQIPVEGEVMVTSENSNSTSPLESRSVDANPALAELLKSRSFVAKHGDAATQRKWNDQYRKLTGKQARDTSRPYAKAVVAAASASDQKPEALTAQKVEAGFSKYLGRDIGQVAKLEGGK